MKYAWTDDAWDDYRYWQQHDPKKTEEINTLLEECSRDPFKGTGKPEPLKGNLTGYCSRRIDKEHRLVYLPEDGCIYIVQCRFHY
ncbi:MAG: Txe/YoeB family addiction module toxin [Thiothrix sp.]|nr:Txe/YoeB family addiction module toxin [Thiothrix sp.]